MSQLPAYKTTTTEASIDRIILSSELEAPTYGILLHTKMKKAEVARCLYTRTVLKKEKPS